MTMNGSDTYVMYRRVVAAARTRLLRRSFFAFGSSSTIAGPIRLVNPGRIGVGRGVYIGSNCWLQGGASGEHQDRATVQIGDRVSISGDATISGNESVIIDDRVLIARGVYICDHSHATGSDLPIMEQGSTEPIPIRIGRGAWIGQGAVILPGATVGVGSVVGAYSVVRGTVPDRHLAVGAPAAIEKLKLSPPTLSPTEHNARASEMGD